MNTHPYSASDSSSDIHIIKTGVLYLRTKQCGPKTQLRPTPHAFAPDSRWTPCIAVLVEYMCVVVLFIFDVDGSIITEIVDIEIQNLHSHNIQIDDYTLFGNAFGFHVFLSREALIQNSGALEGSINNNSYSVSTPSTRRCSTISSWKSTFSNLSSLNTHEIQDDEQTSTADIESTTSPAIDENQTLRYTTTTSSLSSLSSLIKEGGDSIEKEPVLYFNARNAAERNDWVMCLRKHTRQLFLGPVDPPQNILLVSPVDFRIERVIWIKIIEVQGMSKPGDTFAVICTDQVPIAQTDVRIGTAQPRWDNASFLFTSIPPVNNGIYVYVCHKDQPGMAGGILGYCLIPIPYISRSRLYDGWYPLSYNKAISGCCKQTNSYFKPAVNISPSICWPSDHSKIILDSAGKNKGADSIYTPSAVFRSGDIHMQVRYDELIVLAPQFYEGLISLLFESEPTIVFDLVARVPKSSDWIVETCTKISVADRQAVDWIESVIVHELSMQTTYDQALLFRGNSVATRAIDVFMKTVGLGFLDSLIGDVIREIAQADFCCEVDPLRLSEGENVDDNWEILIALLKTLWSNIEKKAGCCPADLRRMFSRLRRTTELHTGLGESVRYSCISGFIFLRMICPAMLSPKAFGLVDSQPSPSSIRTLTLMAKGIQSAANMSDFILKEPYMLPMNAFVQECTPELMRFIDVIASDPDEQTYNINNNDKKLNANYTSELQMISAVSAVDRERELAALSQFINRYRDMIIKPPPRLISPPSLSPVTSSTPGWPPSLSFQNDSTSSSNSPVSGIDSPRESRSYTRRHSSRQRQYSINPIERRWTSHIPTDNSYSHPTMTQTEPPTPSTMYPSGISKEPSEIISTLVVSSIPLHLVDLIEICNNIQSCVDACQKSKYIPNTKVKMW